MSVACSVVIPTYNAEETLGEQLAALAAQECDTPFEVIVADNGSTDASGVIAKQWSGALDLRVVDASGRRGPSAARNIGVQDAQAPLLLFCDADDVVSLRWVHNLTVALKTHEFVGGPCQPFAMRSGVWLPDYDLSKSPVAWDAWAYAFAGNFGITAAAWHRVGGFDESLTGAEEIEFAWRALSMGIKPAFVLDALIAYRARTSLRGRLWHEYNSGRGTAQLAVRLVPAEVPTRSWRSQLRHNAMLVSRLPLSVDGGRWAAWAAVLAFEAGSSAGRRSSK